MSCAPCNTAPCVPCAPVQWCAPVDFGLAFPSLVGPMGPPGGPGLYVTNYAALRALDATVYPEGYVANVGGYFTVGDGGGGQFQYIPSSSTSDNDGTVLSPANGTGRWFRLYSGAVNVKWFGAVGDGSTDDYQAIQNAITYIESLALGGAIFLPSAEYNIEDTLDFTGDKPVVFFGEGEGSTIINAIGAITAMGLGTGSGDKTVDLRVVSMSIIGDGASDVGIAVNRVHQILIDRVKITDFTVAGVDMNMAYNNELRDIFVDNCGTGILVDENNEYTLITRAKVYNCDAVGIHFRNGSCSGSKIMFCDIEACEVGIKVDAGAVENVEGFGVIDCYFKDMADANCLFGTDASAFWIDSLLFQNNEIKDGTAGPATNVVEMDRCRQPVAISNHFSAADFVTSVNIVNLVEFGNSFANAATPPTIVQLGNSCADGNLRAKLPAIDPGIPEEIFENSGVMEVSP